MSGMEIFTPVFAMFILTLLVWLYMYAKRIPFILSNNFSDEEMSPLEFMQRTPPDVANPSDNFKNLFEIPVLFYILCTYLFVSHSVDSTYVIAGWIFFGFRALHSAMHCTANIVIIRFWLYCGATIVFWFMVLRAAIEHLSG